MTQKPLEIPLRFSRGRGRGEEWELATAAWNVERMCQEVGVTDLRDTEVLDVGCGVKLTKLFINHEVPIKRYVGVDVSREMIEFLRANVDDPRFDYRHIDVKNDMYNPTGHPLTEDLPLPLAPGASFDLICLFSVFTHLAPPDSLAMLKLLRPYIRSRGHLFFTLYLNEVTPGGRGLIDSWIRNLPEGEREFGERAAVRLAAGLPAVESFVDLNPAHRLAWAVYSREYAYELIEEAGWDVLSQGEPDGILQHHFVCAPG